MGDAQGVACLKHVGPNPDPSPDPDPNPDQVMAFLKKVAFRGGRILFVSTDPTLARLTRVVGEQTGQLHLTLTAPSPSPSSPPSPSPWSYQ